MKTATEKKKEDKSILILDAAEKILEEEGLNGLSISKVARRAKIAKGTVYLYFSSKEEIIGGLTVKARHALLDFFKEYCEAKKDPIEKIKGVFWADYYFFKEKHTYHQLVAFYEQNTGLEESGKLASASMAIAEYVRDIIEAARLKNRIRGDIDSALQGFIFWGMAVGILQLLETKGQQIPKYFGKTEEEFYAEFVERAIAGIV